MKNELTKITEPKTLSEIVKVAPTLPTIGKLIREGDKEIEVLAFKTIIQIFEFYNEKLNESELTDYIREPNHPKPLILEQFLNQAKQITKPEILIFRDNCLSGKYPLKFRLTPNVFIDWLKEYQFQRMEAFENANLKAKIEVEKQPISEKATEMLKKIAETVKPKPSELVYSTDTSREEQQAKELQKYLTKEFEILWDKQGKNEFDRGRGKYVFHKQGSQMLPDYLKIRFKEIYDKIHEDYKKWDNQSKEVFSLENFIYNELNKIIK